MNIITYVLYLIKFGFSDKKYYNVIVIEDCFKIIKSLLNFLVFFFKKNCILFFILTKKYLNYLI